LLVKAKRVWYQGQTSFLYDLLILLVLFPRLFEFLNFLLFGVDLAQSLVNLSESFTFFPLITAHRHPAASHTGHSSNASEPDALFI
jgi:hypothetical protein